MPFAPARRRTVAAFVAVLATGLAGLAAGPASAAPAAPAPATEPVPSLTAAAREAGVQPGNATMGWQAGESTVSPDAAPQLAAAAWKPSGVLGLDVSSWQGTVNWTSWRNKGYRFAYVKATEGTSYRNPYFSSQYRGSYNAGMVRGAYHFARPANSSGTAQARYFVRNGGGWSADGRTLPGVLDIEYNPYGATCYGLSRARMVTWIGDFTREYKRLTGRNATIYTTNNWWRTCTGNSKKFSKVNKLWVARYGTRTPGTLPGGWTRAWVWQYTNNPIDQNRFYSTVTQLRAYAKGKYKA